MLYSCLCCSAKLGVKDQLPTFPVGRRLAFDPRQGRLSLICTACVRWNNVGDAHTAWKEAEEIAATLDELFADEIFEEFKRQYIVRQAQSE